MQDLKTDLKDQMLGLKTDLARLREKQSLAIMAAVAVAILAGFTKVTPS